MFHIKPCFFSFMMSIRFCTLSPGLDVGHGQPLSQHGDIYKKTFGFSFHIQDILFLTLIQFVIWCNPWSTRETTFVKLKNSLWLSSSTSVTSSAFPSISEYFDPACHAVHWLIYLFLSTSECIVTFHAWTPAF